MIRVRINLKTFSIWRATHRTMMGRQCRKRLVAAAVERRYADHNLARVVRMPGAAGRPGWHRPLLARLLLRSGNSWMPILRFK